MVGAASVRWPRSHRGRAAQTSSAGQYQLLLQTLKAKVVEGMNHSPDGRLVGLADQRLVHGKPLSQRVYGFSVVRQRQVIARPPPV